MQKIQAPFGKKKKKRVQQLSFCVETKHFVSYGKSHLLLNVAPTLQQSGCGSITATRLAQRLKTLSLCPLRARDPPPRSWARRAGSYPAGERHHVVRIPAAVQADAGTPWTKPPSHSAFSHSRWQRTNWTNSKTEDFQKKKTKKKIWASKKNQENMWGYDSFMEKQPGRLQALMEQILAHSWGLHGTGHMNPPLGLSLSDSEEHAHTVQHAANTHPLPAGNCPPQPHTPGVPSKSTDYYRKEDNKLRGFIPPARVHISLPASHSSHKVREKVTSLHQ